MCVNATGDLNHDSDSTLFTPISEDICIPVSQDSHADPRSIRPRTVGPRVHLSYYVQGHTFLLQRLCGCIMVQTVSAHRRLLLAESPPSTLS